MRRRRSVGAPFVVVGCVGASSVQSSDPRAQNPEASKCNYAYHKYIRPVPDVLPNASNICTLLM